MSLLTLGAPLLQVQDATVKELEAVLELLYWYL
jgi:hypothetical protein